MPRAVIRDGTIVPLEPLPAEWADGTEVSVEVASADEARAIDEAFEELDRLCTKEDEEDYRIIQQAIEEQKREQKELMRREMGLPE